MAAHIVGAAQMRIPTMLALGAFILFPVGDIPGRSDRALGVFFRITTARFFIFNHPAHADDNVGFLGLAFTVKANDGITAASHLVFAITRQPGRLFVGGLFIW